MTKDCVEYRFVKRERATVGTDPTDILVSKRDCGALGTLQLAQVEINANNMTARNRLGQAQSDRPGTTAAIEDRRARTEMRHQETRVDVRAS
jgi:hypothetical protein